MEGIESAYRRPRPIHADDRIDEFDCGKPALNEFLRRRAIRNEGRASRTYVVVAAADDDSGSVVAYYSLAAGAAWFDELPGKLSRSMPNPVPVMLLGRLAVDLRHAGRGLGRAMLKEAIERVITASREVGVRAVMVHAIDDEAANFYAQYGFQAFPTGGRTLFLPVETFAQAISDL